MVTWLDSGRPHLGIIAECWHNATHACCLPLCH